MTKLTAIFFSVALVIISCEKNENNTSCNVNNPIEELEWLKQSIENIEQEDSEMAKYSYYMSAIYQGEMVFYYGNCHPAINYVSYVIDCEGNKIGYTSDLYNDLIDQKLLWKHEETECNFADK